MRADLGLDQPFPVQFAHFVGQRGARRVRPEPAPGRKVSSLIVERLPATLELAFVAAVIALVVGIPMGVYAALRRGTFWSQVMMTLSLLGVSLPTFLIGILLILVFAVTAEVAAELRPRRGRVRSAPWTTGLSHGSTAGST